MHEVEVNPRRTRVHGGGKSAPRALKAAVTTRKDVGTKDLEQYNRRILWVVFHVASSVQCGFIFLLNIRLCVCSHKQALRGPENILNRQKEEI